MKWCVAFLLFSIAGFGQNIQPILSGLPVSFGKTKTFNASAYMISLSSGTNSNLKFFSAYNPMTTLNDVTLPDSPRPVKSVLLHENLYRGVKIDSFNPNGATSFSEGIASGVLNLIFNGNGGQSAFLRL